MTTKNRLYKVIDKQTDAARLVTNPKAIVRFKTAVGLIEQRYSDKGIETLWYVSVDRRS